MTGSSSLTSTPTPCRTGFPVGCAPLPTTRAVP